VGRGVCVGRRVLGGWATGVVGVGVTVAVGELVNVGVMVGVPVGGTGGTGVRVSVAVCVGVRVRVEVLVGVRVSGGSAGVGGVKIVFKDGAHRSWAENTFSVSSSN
jgi:hypothetical protein